MIGTKYLCALSCLTCLFFATPAQSSEETLRVAFVYNFLKFIDWPETTPTNQLTLCALSAQNPGRQAISKLHEKSFQQRSVQVLFLDTAEQLQEQLDKCALLYLPESNSSLDIPEQIPTGIVVVADEADPNDERISIVLQRTSGNRLEFLINTNALKQAGVTVSSQLLKLAKNYQGESGRDG